MNSEKWLLILLLRQFKIKQGLIYKNKNPYYLLLYC